MTDAKRFVMGSWVTRIEGAEGALAASDGRTETASEGPTNAGLLAASLRHTEAAWKAAGGMVTVSLKRADQEIERLERRCERYEARYMETLDLYAKLKTGEVERQVMLAEHAEKSKVMQAAGARLMPLLGAIVTKYLGAEGPGSDPLLDAIEEGVGGWEQEDIQRIAEALPTDAKRIEFLTMVQALYERMQQKKAKKDPQPAKAAE